MIRRPPRSTLFPYTTSSDLLGELRRRLDPLRHGLETQGLAELEDRKSTRLNSSHQIISYAVFCLEKAPAATAHANQDLAQDLPLRGRRRRPMSHPQPPPAGFFFRSVAARRPPRFSRARAGPA